MTATFDLSGSARPQHAAAMLDTIEEHFAEHADVARAGDGIVIRNETGEIAIALDNDVLRIGISMQTAAQLQLARTMLAEHLFYLAGDDALELKWSDPPPPAAPANLHEVRVVSTEPVTPHMLRVKFSCADVAPFVGGHLHIRLLVPPRGREPVWPVIGEDGRLQWPEGEDALLIRVYTIRHVDLARNEVWVDFLQHPDPETATPGADFARDAQPGDRAAFLGPGGGTVPQAQHIFLAGDEAALPAIARIAREASPESRLTAIIEVEDPCEQQTIESAATLDLRWLHRNGNPASGALSAAIREAIAELDGDAFVWVACERSDMRDIRNLLKSRGHESRNMYVAWYWERGKAG